MTDALVIGAGPAGLMAADVLSAAGHRVLLADAMPTPGRKFLMAGKSGLNLTKAENPAVFRGAFGARAPAFDAALRAFGPQAVADWAAGLGQPTFAGSTGRVFPVAMKASPLLRAWLTRLAAQGVVLRTGWRWQGWRDGAAVFGTGAGEQLVIARATVLALGGASWPRLGSDGGWAGLFPGQVAGFQPSNVGLRVNWSAHMAPFTGQPVKGVALRAGGQVSRGECVIVPEGLEGGGIYPLIPALRTGAGLTADLFPDLTPRALAERLSRLPVKASLSGRLRKLGLSPVQAALVQEWGRPVPTDLTALLRALPVPHRGPRGMDQAISTAGGLRFDALDGFMLRDRPGVFAAGEMLDWDAPTGGYLVTACLATGRAAGVQAAGWLG